STIAYGNHRRRSCADLAQAYLFWHNPRLALTNEYWKLYQINIEKISRAAPLSSCLKRLSGG
ncbi:MAG: hypothetical protein ACLT3G_14980, partial [Acutalibacteraceae bacterium]